MYTLGLNAAFHDPAACLVEDGRLLAAAEEERFTRVKHGKRPVPFTAWELPFHAIDYCLKEAGIALRDVDHVAYSFDPWLLLDRAADELPLPLPLRPAQVRPKEAWGTPWDPLFLCYQVNAPLQLVEGAPLHLRARFRGVGPDSFRWHYVAHHLAHAASAFHASPFGSAAVMILDGRGELATTSYAAGEGACLRFLGDVRLPHSLGLLCEQVTAYLGFLRSSEEPQLAALAALGRPRHLETFREIIRLGADGRYTIDDPRLELRFGPARAPDSPLEARHFDLARSLQQALEEAALELACWLRDETGERRLCLAGGVALNCVLNSRLRDGAGYERVWVQPAAGDAGTALGAALWVDSTARGGGRRGPPMEHARLGPEYSEEELEAFLLRAKLPYRRLGDAAEAAAELLAAGKLVGWFQGRMEFGPRSLGARSILASPSDAAARARLNAMKEREPFRPASAVVLEEEASAWFRGGAPSSFMSFVDELRPDKAPLAPAVRNVDGTSRVQSVRRDQDPLYHALLSAFRRRTGLPLLANASFSARGEPIVRSPREAVQLFWSSPLDALVLGPFLLEKSAPGGGQAGAQAAEQVRGAGAAREKADLVLHDRDRLG